MAERIAIVVMIAVVAGCMPTALDSPSATGGPSATEGPTATASASQPVAIGWEVRPLQIDGRVNAVASSELGWVAVGNSALVGSGLWFSLDGHAWQPIQPLPDAQGGVYGIVVGGPGFVAFGNDATIDFGKPFIWNSTNGGAWAPASGHAFDEYGGVRSMATLQGVLIGAGGVIVPGTDAGHAALWRSTDGVEWTRIDLDGGGTWAVAVVEFGGTLLAVGGSQRPLGGRVWSSADGLEWGRVAVTGLEFAYVRDAIVFEDRLLVVGAARDENEEIGRPAIWASTNGVDWQMIHLDECCEASFSTIDTDGSSVLAITDSAVYSSADGVTWRADGVIDGSAGPIWLTSLEVLPGLGLVALGDDGGTPVLLIPPEAKLVD